VVEFKRGVYEMALNELSRYVPRIDARADSRSRYMRGSMRRDGAASAVPAHDLAPLAESAALELPPGASFDPDPQNELLGRSASKP
jgi:putative (di)nucleoside polyphosphate hydrolase